MKYNHSEIIRQLKEVIKQREKHTELLNLFKGAIQTYFVDNYNIHVKVIFFGKQFAIEQDFSQTYMNDDFFEFHIQELYDFCKEFECEFVRTDTDGVRYFFKFEDIDVRNAFCEG